MDCLIIDVESKMAVSEPDISQLAFHCTCSLSIEVSIELTDVMPMIQGKQGEDLTPALFQPTHVFESSCNKIVNINSQIFYRSTGI